MLQGRKSDRVRKLIEERGCNAVKYYVWNLVQQHKKGAKYDKYQGTKQLIVSRAKF